MFSDDRSTWWKLNIDLTTIAWQQEIRATAKRANRLSIDVEEDVSDLKDRSFEQQQWWWQLKAKLKELYRFLSSSVRIRRFLFFSAFQLVSDRLNLKMCRRFNDDFCFNAFLRRANLHSFFNKFISYRLFFWQDKSSMLSREKNNKIMWVQSHVALPLTIKFSRSLFRDNCASNFDLLNSASLFRFQISDSCVSERSLFLICILFPLYCFGRF